MFKGLQNSRVEYLRAARDVAACSTESAAILFHALGSRARPPKYERVGASLDNEVKLEDMI